MSVFASEPHDTESTVNNTTQDQEKIAFVLLFTFFMSPGSQSVTFCGR